VSRSKVGACCETAARKGCALRVMEIVGYGKACHHGQYHGHNH
jgi:hypothetical protein